MQNLSCENDFFFYYHANKTHIKNFHKKGFALGLLLRVRVLKLGNGLLVISPITVADLAA